MSFMKFDAIDDFLPVLFLDAAGEGESDKQWIASSSLFVINRNYLENCGKEITTRERLLFSSSWRRITMIDNSVGRRKREKLDRINIQIIKSLFAFYLNKQPFLKKLVIINFFHRKLEKKKIQLFYSMSLTLSNFIRRSAVTS